MPAHMRGICPNCDTRGGPVGAQCPSDICSRKGYHLVPVGWYESAREYAARKHKPLDPFLGRCLERYLVAGILGEGGMGAVYYAYQRPLDREVALKVISGVELNEAAITRFEREARAIALLDHANIRKLYDYGVAKLEFRIPYMALEYVRHGRTLRRALASIEEEKGHVPSEVVLGIFRQVLNALGAAHEQGIVHRDMKPENVMIAPEYGNPYMVKILDFGLAKAISNLSGLGHQDVTSSGVLLGTPKYMAPEQASGRHSAIVDARADLYAVAVMLFEIFTGVPPFSGDSALAILVKKTDPRFSPFDLPEARDLPDGMRAFLARGLAPEPAGRFSTAAEMLTAFEYAIAQMDSKITTTIKIAIPIPTTDPPRTPASTPTSVNRAGHSHKTLQTVQRPIPRIAWWVGLAFLAAGAGSGVVYLIRDSGSHVARSSSHVGLPSSSQVFSMSADATIQDQGLRKAMDISPDPGSPGSEPPLVSSGFRAHHRFWIRTRPPGARVAVQNTEIGVSPVAYDFVDSQEGLSKEIDLHVSLMGFRDVRKKVRLSEAIQAGEVFVDLERLPTGVMKSPRKYRKPTLSPEQEGPTRL